MKRRELYHHGIQGQKWGKRNGPPYPLARHSAAERKALDKFQKQRYNRDKAVERGRYAVGKILGEFGGTPLSEFLRNSGGSLKFLPKPESVEEVLKNTNPTNGRNNCYNCVVAATARMCGIDAVARGDDLSRGAVSFDDVCEVFNLNPDNPKDVIRMTNPNMSKAINQIARNYSDGDIGAIAFAWDEDYCRQTNQNSPGHTINWIIQNGTPQFIDTQIGLDNSIITPFVSEHIGSGKELSVAKFATVNDDFGLDVNQERFKKFVK